MARPARTKVTEQQARAIMLLVHKDTNKMTNEDIANEVGVTVQTLHNWKNKPYFNDELVKKAEEVQRAILADGYNILRTIINSPNAKDTTKLKALELAFKNQGRLKEVREDTVTVEEKSMSDMLDELEDL